MSPLSNLKKLSGLRIGVANIVKALEDLIRDDCIAHLINTVVKSTLTLTFVELRQKAVKDQERVGA